MSDSEYRTGIEGAGALSPAPYYADVACGGQRPPQTFWLWAADGLRLRAALWGAGGTRGLVFLLSGRTEVLERFGHVTDDLVARGYTVLSVEWRGQGLSDRIARDPMVGHVDAFQAYQNDVDTLIACADKLGLPGPRYLIAHSMGACIALRSLVERRLDVRAVAFSSPMWGVSTAYKRLRPLIQLLRLVMRPVWPRDEGLFPGRKRDVYLLTGIFQGNTLTSDREMWDTIRRQVGTYTGLGIGGPTIGWAYGALEECHWLETHPSPDVPALAWLGSDERVVLSDAVRARMARWPGSEIALCQGARHEIMIERPERRQAFIRAADHLFQRHAGP